VRKLALLGALGALLSPIAASAAPGIASLPVGQSVRYHVTTNTSKPPAAGGSSSTDHFILLTRSAPAAFAVVVDGAPSGTIAVDPSGGLSIPPNLQSVLKPFGIVAKLMRGAPSPIAAGSSWAATVPVPLGDTTDNVTAFVHVVNLGPGGISVAASGQNATEVQAGLREHNAQVDFSASIAFDARRVLTNASGSITADVHKGLLRNKTGGDTWSITIVP
jgi:hypothetical protein